MPKRGHNSSFCACHPTPPPPSLIYSISGKYLAQETFTVLLIPFTRNYVSFYNSDGVHIFGQGLLDFYEKTYIVNKKYVHVVHSLTVRFFKDLTDDKKHKGFAVQIPCSAEEEVTALA
jgi:hypothetical protein